MCTKGSLPPHPHPSNSVPFLENAAVIPPRDGPPPRRDLSLLPPQRQLCDRGPRNRLVGPRPERRQISL
nr:hypothetical protein DWUX_268 [Desulfovibrio diazotrophicus]